MTLPESAGATAHVPPRNCSFSTLARGAAPTAAGASAAADISESTSPNSAMAAGPAARAGLPAGSFNPLGGAGEIGAAPAGHKDIAQVAFTESVETERKTLRAVSTPATGSAPELGGKSPVAAPQDADLDAAAKNAGARHLFQRRSGQRRRHPPNLPTRRDALGARIRARAEAMEMGGPPDDPADGPSISADQSARVEDFAARAKAAWPASATGGNRADRSRHFYPPAIFADTPVDAEITQCEVFCPRLRSELTPPEERRSARAKSILRQEFPNPVRKSSNMSSDILQLAPGLNHVRIFSRDNAPYLRGLISAELPGRAGVETTAKNSATTSIRLDSADEALEARQRHGLWAGRGHQHGRCDAGPALAPKVEAGQIIADGFPKGGDAVSFGCVKAAASFAKRALPVSPPMPHRNPLP